MLRNRRQLLEAFLAAFFTLSLGAAIAGAQIDDEFAPWRLETFEPLEQNLPDTLKLDLFPSDSHLYSLRITCKFQREYSAHRTAEPSPYRVGPKISLNGPGDAYLGLALEKDPGEKQVWDHSAMTASIPVRDVSGRLILGDFLAGFGSGLVIRTARNFGLGRDTQSNLRLSPKGIRPYNGWDEELALRGAAFQAQHGNLDLTAWGSSRKRGVSVDTAGAIRSFNSSASQEALENGWGGRLSYSIHSPCLAIGTTFCATSWDRSLRRDSRLMSRTAAADIDVGWTDSTITASVEAAWDDRGQSAQMGTVRWTRSPFYLQQAVYQIDPDYFAPLASSLDLGQGEVCNRSGSYSGLGWRSRRANLSGFMHLYRYPRRLSGQSWGGSDLSISAEGSPLKPVRLALASRWVKEQEPDRLDQVGRWRGLGRIDLKPLLEWDLKAGIQLSRAGGINRIGQLLSVGIAREMKISSSTGLDGSLAAGVYQANDFAARLYWSEADPSGCLRVRPLWGNGEVIQAAVTLRKQGWGRASFAFWQDQQDHSDWNETIREITVVFRYP
jgi:hypothetical protein